MLQKGPKTVAGTCNAANPPVLLVHGSLQDAGGGRRFRQEGGCLIKLTSGSTGLPKPLLFTQAQMAAGEAAMREAIRALGGTVTLRFGAP